MNRLRITLLICSCLAVTASCGPHFNKDTNDLIDPQVGLSRDDYRTMSDTAHFQKDGGPQASAGLMEPPVPDLAEILAAPKPPKLGETQLVSVAVTDDV